MRAVFLDFGTVSNGDLDHRPAPACRAGHRDPRTDGPGEVPARVAGFEAVFANKSVIDRATIGRTRS